MPPGATARARLRARTASGQDGWRRASERQPTTAVYESAAQMFVAVPFHENCVVAPLASIVKVIRPTKS